MLHTYLMVPSNFYALFIDNGESAKKCQHIDADGICWKNAAEEYRFCRLHRR